MVESLTFEEAQKLQQGDEICLSVDLGNGWTPARRLSVRSINVVHSIDEKRKKSYAKRLLIIQNPQLISDTFKGTFESSDDYEAALEQRVNAVLGDFPTDVVLIAADDLSAPLGKFRKGEDTITYAGVDYFPHVFYSRQPSN